MLKRRLPIVLFLVVAILCVLPPLRAAAAAGDGGEGAGHGDLFAIVFRGIAIVLIAAVVGRFLARALKQSPVLGELAMGILAGAILYQAGSPGIVIIRHGEIFQRANDRAMTESVTWNDAVAATLAESALPGRQAERVRRVAALPDFSHYKNLATSLLLFSSLGVVLLLFMVGLESSLPEMRAVAGSSLGVAVVGVVAPFALGFGTALLFLPRGAGLNTPIFIGATLCATSIGITARVFRDMNRLAMPEARIVLGAAVLDDVLGLIVLAVVSGVITSGAVQFLAAGMIVLKAVLFLGAVIVFGLTLQRKNIALFEWLDRSSAKLVYPFALLMLLAWAADAIGLATIVGAFAAGLILEERHFGPEGAGAAAGAGAHGGGSVESVIAPLEGIFAPVFFVLMGMQVDVGTFLEWKVLLLGLAFTLVAVLGKLAAGLAAGRGLDRLTIGIGLVPRGEVGLIFAGIGRALGVLDVGLFSVIIIVVLLTTVATPPLLTWSVGRARRVRPA